METDLRPAENALRSPLETVKKTMKCSFAIEPQGKSEGGKAPPSRSIKQFFKRDKFEKLDGQRGEKTFSTR